MSGAVVWITGLPCSGKSTLAAAVATAVREGSLPVVVLDGDELRGAIAPDLGYSLPERNECGWRYARLAALLAAQGVLVIVATLSMFEEIRAWNRANAPRYVEVFLRVPEDVRRRRDRRGLFARREVVGVDLPFEEPRSPDLVVDDDGSASPGRTAQRVARVLAERGCGEVPGRSEG